MSFLATLFLISLLSGQLIRIPIAYGITVYPHDIVLCCYLFFWFTLKYKKKNFTFGSLGKPLCLFLIALLASFAVNALGHTVPELINGISYSIRIALYIGLYVVISNTKKKSFWLSRLYGIGVLFGILGIVQYIAYPNLRNLEYLGWDPHYYRLFSTLLDPNYAGLFLILTFLLGMNFLLKNGNEITFLVLQAIVLSALTLTLSRSSYVSFIGIVFLYAWWKKSWKILIGIVVFIGILFWLPLPQKNVTPILRLETSVSRMTNWAQSVELIKKAPVFGHGFNLLRSIQEPGYGKKDTENISHASAGVDNSFLFVLATTGLVGAVAWGYLLFSMWKLGRKNIVYVLSLVAIGIHSLFVNSMFYPWIMIWMWILTGIEEKRVNVKNNLK